jgi:hypothetical protein
MKKLLTTLALVAGLLFGGMAAPAQADEPAPVDPCASQNRQVELLTAEVERWKGRAEEANENASAQAVVAVNRALAAEDRADRTARELGARTVQRDRLLYANNHLRAQRDRLRIKVAELRAKIRALR